MGVLIHNIWIPETGYVDVRLFSDGRATTQTGDRPFYREMKIEEVPEKHGRLIDADKITEHKYTTIPPHRKKYADGKPKSEEEIIAFKFGWNYAIDAIVENAPTIIPASEDGE